MKVTENHFEESNLCYQVVMKFKNSLGSPVDALKEFDCFSDDSVFFRWRILKLFPGITIERLFTSVEHRQIIKLIDRAKKTDAGFNPADFFSFYTISCPPGIEPDKLLKTLTSEKTIELAYIENIPVPPPSIKAKRHVLQLPNYLQPAPVGIDALYAWNFPGRDGGGSVKFIDIEQGWLTNHETVCLNTLSLTGKNHHGFRDHGIAVLGIIMMTTGGITSKTKGSVVSQWRTNGLFNTADAIMYAISELKYGDILLLEMQCFDSPKSNNVWPIEIQEAVFQTIRLATALGIIVIETAANGNLKSRTGNDLDDLHLYGRKIFDCNCVDFRDSGAILVSACSNSLQHKKAYYSNYGNRVNCFAHGQNIQTAGNFPRSSGMAINTYTNQFGGTSAAAAIIAGAAIALQNISEQTRDVKLSPHQMRSVLSNELYNTASANGKSLDKIGVMPDLKNIIDHKFSSKQLIKRKATTIY